MSQQSAHEPGSNLSGPSQPGAADEAAFGDDVLEPEVDPGLHHVRSEHRGMPLHPDDDALAAAVERDRVAAGLADYAPGDVPDAADEDLPAGTDPAVDLAQRGLLGDTTVDES